MGGVSIGKGSIKYIFTQAATPTSEGEVEGSLWYDTTTSDLYTYDGAAWNLVTSGAWTKVNSGALGGTATETISGIGTYDYYLLIVNGYRAAGGVAALYFNSDGAGTSYDYKKLTGTTLADVVNQVVIWLADCNTTIPFNATAIFSRLADGTGPNSHPIMLNISEADVTKGIGLAATFKSATAISTIHLDHITGNFILLGLNR